MLRRCAKIGLFVSARPCCGGAAPSAPRVPRAASRRPLEEAEARRAPSYVGRGLHPRAIAFLRAAEPPRRRSSGRSIAPAPLAASSSARRTRRRDARLHRLGADRHRRGPLPKVRRQAAAADRAAGRGLVRREEGDRAARDQVPDVLVQEHPQDRQPRRLRQARQAAARQQHHRDDREPRPPAVPRVARPLVQQHLGDLGSHRADPAHQPLALLEPRDEARGDGHAAQPRGALGRQQPDPRPQLGDVPAAFQKLQAVNFVGNPFCQEPEYRPYVLSHLKWVKYLDYRLVDEQAVVASSSERRRASGRAQFAAAQLGMPAIARSHESPLFARRSS